MENVQNQNVSQAELERREQFVEEAFNDDVVKEQFPTDEMLQNMNITREEFEQKVEEGKKRTPQQQEEDIQRMIEENKKLQEELQQMNKQMERTNLITSLTKNGLSEFTGLFDLDSNDEKVEFLKKVKNDILVANSYVPKDVAKQDEYTQAIQSGDTEKAISFKLSKLFGGK